MAPKRGEKESCQHSFSLTGPVGQNTTRPRAQVSAVVFISCTKSNVRIPLRVLDIFGERSVHCTVAFLHVLQKIANSHIQAVKYFCPFCFFHNFVVVSFPKDAVAVGSRQDPALALLG